jgi:23S rRNA (guanosine2251-2'-O)-methyltransferase
VVVVPKDNSAELNAVARKVASGAAEVIPLVRVTNLARTLRSFKELGIWIVGTTGDANTLVYDQDLSIPTALVMGAEGPWYAPIDHRGL